MKTIFEPYTVRFILELATACSTDRWGRILIEFMDALAGTIMQAGPCMIGHLKGFTQAPNFGFVKISTIGAGHPADIRGDWKGCAKRLSLDLNVSVYGLNRDVLADCAKTTIAASGESWRVCVLMQPSAKELSNCCSHKDSN